jgi:hypothetical protein
MGEPMSPVGTSSFRCAAEFGRYRGIADTGKPSARQVYGFTPRRSEAVALPDRCRPPPRHKADSGRFGYPFDLQVLVRLDKM